MHMYKRGWFGHSHEHSLARRGIRKYNATKEPHLVDPLFYAKKREEKVSFTTLVEDARKGRTYDELVRKYPDVDKEELRVRGIRAVESRTGNNVLSQLNSNGVDESVRMAENNRWLKDKMYESLNDRQQSSFLQTVKIDLLKQRLREV
jgi:hypothetical protein